MNRDLVSDLSASVLIASATYQADTTPAGVDISGYRSATVFIEVGAGGITFTSSNKVEFVLQESDDNVTFTNVAAADVIHAPQAVVSGIVYALTAAHAAGTVVRLGYKGAKRYLQLIADFSGTHASGTPLSAIVVAGHPLSAPVA